MRRALAMFLLAATVSPAASSSRQLRLAVVQLSPGPSLQANLERMLEWIGEASRQRARVVVFPEAALHATGRTVDHDLQAATEAIQRSAQRHQLYVLYGGLHWSGRRQKETNWMKVISPAGAELLHYDKLWEIRDAPAPELFQIDGIPAGAILCADRWLRGLEDLPVQRGAQILFELSNNFAVEWVPELQWYWYVPRALRNSVWVVFANSGNRIPGQPEPWSKDGPRHGHSAVIAPDGSLAAAAHDDGEQLLVADIEVSRASRAEALARRQHPVVGRFWRSGLEQLLNTSSSTPMLAQKDCPNTELTVATAQIAETSQPDRNALALAERIAEASRRGADLIVFGELTLTAGRAISSEKVLPLLCQAAKAGRITVVFGMPWQQDGKWRNSAFVLGPDGSLLTRYDQMVASRPFDSGRQPASMWFEVRGVPAVVTIGKEVLWNEFAELAAVAGARLLIHLARQPVPDRAAHLRRRQTGAAFASYGTLTVMANAAGYSAIWEDLNASEETRSVLQKLPRPEFGPALIFSPFSANLVAEAGQGPSLILARRRIPGRNDHYPRRTARFHPSMAAWYVRGASILMGQPAQ